MATVTVKDTTIRVVSAGKQGPPGTGEIFKTYTELKARNTASVTDGTARYVSGRSTAGDGGEGWFAWRSGDQSANITADSGEGVWVPPDSDATGASGAWERLVGSAHSAADFGLSESASGGDNQTALANALGYTNNLPVVISDGTYTVDSGITITDQNRMVNGGGWFWDSADNELGSIIEAADNTVADLLTFNTSTPLDGTTNTRRIEFSNLGLIHKGSGAALTFDNVTSPHVKDTLIECELSGVNGIEFDNWSFFASVERSLIRQFEGVGILIGGTGFSHYIHDCHVSTSSDNATAAIEVQRPDARITYGQINVNRSDNTGIGILFNNTGGSPIRGGVAEQVACEFDVGVKITGDTDTFDRVFIKNPHWNLSQIAKGVVFGRSRWCVLEYPQITNPNGGGVLAEFESTSAYNGIITDFQGAQCPITVDAGASFSWMRVTGVVPTANLSSITTDSNLTVFVDKHEELGPMIHNGTAWDKATEVIADDASTTFTPPSDRGIVEVNVFGGNRLETARATFDPNAGMASLATGGSATVDASVGTLGGTTGADGDLTIRCSATPEIHVENRLGPSARVWVRFITLDR